MDTELTAESSEVVHLGQYWDLLVSGWKTVSICFGLTVLTGLLATLSTTPVYRATTTLQIEPDTPRILNFEDMFQVDATADAFYQTQYQLMESRSLARRVIDRQGLLPPEQSGDVAASGGGLLSSLRSSVTGGLRNLLGGAPGELEAPVAAEMNDQRYTLAIDDFLSRLEVEPIAGTRLARISWTNTSPVVAARIVNAVAANYIDVNLEAKFASSEQAAQFLAEEIGRLQGEVSAAEAELQRFGNERDILSLNERQDTITQALADLNAEHTRAQTDRVQKQAYYEQLQDADPSMLAEVAGDPLIQRLNSDYAGMQQRYTELSLRFTDDWPEVRSLLEQMNDLQARLEREKQRAFGALIGSARQEFSAAAERERRVSDLLEQQKLDAIALNSNLLTYRSLQIEIDSRKEMLDSLHDRQSETGVSSRLQGLRTSSIRIVDPAVVPLSPFKPRARLNLVMAAVMGLMLGMAVVFLREYLDDTIRTAEDVERRITLPPLGLLPSMGGSSNGNGRRGSAPIYDEYDRQPLGGNGDDTWNERVSHALAVEYPRSPEAEAYRGLRTSLLLSRAGSPPQMVLVTSANQGDGKTTVAANLAASLAESGKKVLLIDADLRRPRVHEQLGLDNGQGLVTFLATDCSAKEIVQSTRIPNLWAVPVGPRPPNPAELLGSERARTFLDAVRSPFEIVIVDSPPTLPVVDALLLVPRVDGALLVVRSGVTPSPSVSLARRKIEEIGGSVLGVVLNDIPKSKSYYYGYGGYAEYYGADIDELEAP